MNTKNFFKLGALVVVLMMALSAMAFGQTTYYVNSQTGLDGNSGLAATGGSPGGPKLTITNAIAAASAGDIIVVDFGNGAVYNENVTVTKRLTFGVSSNSGTGAPTVTSWTVNITGTNNTCTFTGAFNFTTGITLQSGSVVGAGNLTVGGTVTRYAISATSSSTVDAQLNYTGTVNFVYLGGFAITTGLEIAPSSNSTTIGSITTTGAGTNLTLSESKTMNGTLTTSGTLALGGGTLTISGANAHTIAGNVTGGTLAFTLTGAASVTGNFTLPNITATRTTAATLTISTTTTVGNLTASGAASIAAAAATAAGNVTNNGSGAITLGAATTVSAVSNTSSGTITLTAATTIASLSNSGSGSIAQGAAGATAVTGNVLQTGTGSITFASTGGVTISGTLTNSPAIAFTGGSGALAQSNLGLITFADGVVTVAGATTNAPSFSGATTTGTTGQTTTWTNNGQIRFAATAANLTFTGGITVNAISNLTNGGNSTTTGATTITGNGAITFASTSGNILSAGGFSNTSNWPNLSGTAAGSAQTGNGSIIIASRTTGTIGTLVAAVGPVSNSAVGTNGSTNGDLNFGTGGGFFGSSITSSGAAGGAIILGNESVSLSGGVTNARTSALATGHIVFGSAATVGVTFSIGGDVTNSGASSIFINSYNNAAAENFAVAGKLVSSGTGKIDLALAALTGTGTFSLGGIELTAGEIDLSGGGAATATITVNGQSNFAAGKLTLTTSAARTLRLGALTNNFSTATTSTDFSTTANVTLLVQASTIFGQQTINGNSTTTVWYGPISLNNTNNNAVVPGIILQGGNFRALGLVTFAGSKVDINNITLFIGGQPPAFPAAGGDFTNTSGYTTTGNGFVSMNNSTANQTVSGAGDFGNFEVDAAANTVTFAAATGSIKGLFNLTSGTVVASANVNFNNTTTPPTIVRNAGTFDAAPTFTSKVNVYYIGLDKGTSNELPVAANKLQDLTVATTNGATAGKGTVNVGVATTVNGTLTVNSGQALLINGVNLSVKGATIALNGDITNDVGGVGRLVLSATTGTTITGSGALPDITVAASSVGNAINGSVGLATGLLGGNNLRGTDDVNPGVGGSITFTAATSTPSSLTVTFGTANTTSGLHIGNGVTTSAGSTFTLGADLLQGGNLTHVGGTVDVGAFTYTHRGLLPAFTGGALTIGSGSLSFTRTAAGNVLFSAITSDVTILANVVVNLSATGDLFQIDPATAGHLIISGNLTLTRGTIQLGDGVTARNLTLTGTTFTIGTSGAINTTGIGTLRLNASLPPLTMSFTGTPTLGNVRVSNDVVLAGTGTSLTVNGTLTHDGGNIDFSTRTLAVGATGTYARTAGTYSATTGYFVFSGVGGTFGQGATAVTIPNLRLSSAAAANMTGAGVLTVSTALDVSTGAAFTHTVSSAAKLAVADAATVNYTSGSFDVAPTYAGTITLVTTTGNAVTIHATVWPATATLVTTLRVNNTLTTDAVYLPGARTVNTTLDLRRGVLDLSTGNATSRALTLADNATVRRRQPGSLTLDFGGTGTNAGTITFGANTSVVYESNNATAYAAGPELPATVKDITFTRSSNVANAAVTVNVALAVNGVLLIRNDLTTGVNGIISANGDVTIATETATYAAATAPVTTFGAALQFVGTTAATITVPSVTVAPFFTGVGAITINKTGGVNVTLAGGNLSSTNVTFISGLFMTGSNWINFGGNAVNGAFPGYTRTVAAGSKSHVVGNVRVPLKLGQIIAFGRNEFPVGDATNYRPAALTFVNSALPAGIALGVSATVKYDPTRPTGIVGLPIADGVSQGTDVARYPDFNWSIATTGSLGATQFNLELTAEGYTGFDDVANVRIIRRNGAVSDITNQWTLQGAQYDNFVISGVPSIVNVNSVGGLIQGGAIFTYGLKSTMVIANPIATINLTDAAGTFTRNLTNPALFTGAQSSITYSVSVANSAIITATITNNVLTVTKKVSGSTSITVIGTDTFDGSRINHTVAVNVVSDVETGEVVPTEFTLSQNYPNPFNPSTTIKFGLPKEAPVTLEIYNVLGVKVRTLIAGETMSAAFHTLVWDGKNDGGVAVPSGVYLYRVHADQFQASKKMTLIK